MDNFELSKLEELIYSASKKAFSKTIELHKNEDFYGFALYTYDALGYVLPTSFTEEGLKQAVEKYKNIPSFSEKSDERLLTELRWSPCDSPLHCEFEEEFVEANELLNKIEEKLDGLFNQDKIEEFENRYSDVKAIFFNVLKRLDEEFFFEKTNVREKLVLNLLMRDQSDEEILNNAEKLNSKVIYENFKRNYES